MEAADFARDPVLLVPRPAVVREGVRRLADVAPVVERVVRALVVRRVVAVAPSLAASSAAARRVRLAPRAAGRSDSGVRWPTT